MTVKEQTLNLADYHIDKSWTLFLDRDGVINHRIVDDYVKNPAEFEFLENVPEAIKKCNEVFGKIFVVTNQQGIGKGLMSVEQLKKVHAKMLNGIEAVGGHTDGVYFCPELASSNHPDRKPNIGMARKAKRDFSEVNFLKSIMVGDSKSDMEFGRNAGMKTVFISKTNINFDEKLIDYNCESLSDFSNLLKIYQ